VRHRLAAVVGLLALVAAGCGGHDHTSGAGDSAAAARTIRIEMRDTAYSPESIEVDKGETVRFVFTNKGTVPHDAFVGDAAAQTTHEEEMRADGGEHHHGGDGVTVEPGKTADLTETFEQAGTTFIGCHEPGHWDAGMKLTVTVA
jgi:uncharacterized cupredoxin-like copper-binding protein